MTASTVSEAAIEKSAPYYGTLMRDDVVRLEIGPDLVEYFVHPGLLIHHSEYFKRALNGDWKEAAEKGIKLDDVDCKTFEIFLEWLYTQRFPQEERFREGRKGREGRRENQLATVKACAFGDRFLASAFREAAESTRIDCLVVFKRSVFYETIIYAYEHLPANNLVLQAMVDVHCRDFAEKSDTELNGKLELRSKLPHNFLVDVMLRYMRWRNENWKPLDRCDYHRHASDDGRGEECQIQRVEKP